MPTSAGPGNSPFTSISAAVEASVNHGQPSTSRAAAARAAYRAFDADASITVHKAKDPGDDAKEVHGGAGSDYIKSIVFGGLDGE